MTQSDDLVTKLSEDWRKADLSEDNRAMLYYAEKLTLEPWNVREKDVIALRKVGFSDRAILDINQVASYYAFVNRIADGLGVKLEAYWQED